VHEQIDFDTWIDDEFIRAYTTTTPPGTCSIHRGMGEEKLVGGMYGISIGKIFCGESMFSRISNTSKMALIHVCESKRYTLLDCQVPTPHLASMGARLVSREAFLKMIKMYGQST
jgi:leucyl/phenylalanyl-tRNA--protein transferase